MKRKAEPAEPRRIKLRVDFSRSDYITRAANDFADFANNKVVPLMNELGFEVTMSNILKYSENNRLMKSDFVQREKDVSKVDNEYLLKMVEADAENKFDELYNRNPFDGKRTAFPDLLKCENGRVVVDANAAKEAATVYVEEPHELEAYDRHQAAVKALNDFFQGDAPQFIENYFPSVNGTILAGTSLVDYKRFIRK